MEDFKNMLLNSLNEFVKGKKIDWTVAMTSEEKFEAIIDSLDVLIEGISFLPQLDENKKITLIGKLVLNRARLTDSYYNNKNLNAFLEHCQALEPVLREIVTVTDWLSSAQDRFEEYAEFEQSVSEDEDIELTSHQMDYFRPILMALALLALISLDQEEYVHEEDEDCDDEHCS